MAKNKKTLTLLFFWVCCSVPFANQLLTQEKVTLFGVVAAIAGTIGAVYAVYQTVHSNLRSEALHGKSDAIVQDVRRLSVEVTQMRHELGLQLTFLSLSEASRGDTSEAALAWRRIQGKTTPGPYYRYCEEYPDSPHAQEAEKRRYALAAWDKVDQGDPYAIHFFLLTAPFEALRLLAEARIREAIEKSKQAHRNEFWRQVGIPLRVFIPLLPLAYVLLILLVTGLYRLAGHQVIAAYIPVVTKLTSTALDKFGPSLPPLLHGHATWIVAHSAQLLRLTLTAALTVVLGLVLAGLIGLVWREWLAPRVRDIEERLDYSSAESVESVS